MNQTKKNREYDLLDGNGVKLNVKLNEKVKDIFNGESLNYL